MVLFGCFGLRLMFTAMMLNIYMITDCCDDMSGNYVRLADVQFSNEFILSSKDRATRVDCLHDCEKNYVCVLFCYNTETQVCSLHSQTLPASVAVSDVNSNCYMDDDFVESWVEEVIRVSSSGTPLSRLIGPSDSQFWLPSSVHHSPVLKLRFATEMYIEQVHIYEMRWIGGVERISLMTAGGTWYTVWSTDQLEAVWLSNEEIRILSPTLEKTNFTTSVVRIDIGARQNKYEYIDAVRITGKRQRISHYPLSTEPYP